MPTPPLTDEQAAEAAEAYRQHGTKLAAAAALNISPGALHNRLRTAAMRGLMGTEPVLPGFRISQISNTPKGTYVQQRPEHGGTFEVPAGHSVKGVSTLLNAEGQIVQQWMKTRAEPSTEDMVAEIRAALQDIGQRAAPSPAPSYANADIATLYPIADWHIGLLSWRKETGHNYDLAIAKETIGAAMARLVQSAPPSKVSVVLGLGDLLHSDGYEPMTARSKNILDVDGRYPRVLRTAVYLLIQTIGLALEKHETVIVRILPGNHDDQSAIAVSLALSLYYEHEPRVTVDDDPGRFWWWSWGNVFLGATHGDQAKMKDLPLIMAARNPEAWGRSKFRHILTGHIHTQTGIEMNGVTVESFQTPAAPDAWHHGMGYGAGRSVSAITYHREHGEISRAKVNIL